VNIGDNGLNVMNEFMIENSHYNYYKLIIFENKIMTTIVWACELRCETYYNLRSRPT